MLNVFSWYQIAAALKTIKNLKKGELDIAAIQEVRWTDNGTQISKSVVFYSENPNQQLIFRNDFVTGQILLATGTEFRLINEYIC